MRRTSTINLILGGIAVVALAAILLWATGNLSNPEPRPVLTKIAKTPSPALVPSSSATAAGTPAGATTPTPPPPTARVLPDLPPLTAPPGGQVYTLAPAADAVGWVGSGDEKPNHFGDYNIYAGIFEGQSRLGAVQFDLSAIPPGAPVEYADLTLVGLTDKWLGREGAWTVHLLAPWQDENWPTRSFADLALASGLSAQLEPTLTAGDLAAGRANLFVLGPQALEEIESRVLSGKASFRIDGPASGADNLFSWDSGHGSGSQGWAPVLRIAAGPAPDRPPQTPTPQYVIVTSTPTPANLVTLAALAASATSQAATTGTPTPLPPNWVTPVVIMPTETAANSATAQWHAELATAQVSLYGTATPLPANVWTATPAAGLSASASGYVVVTNTPTPANWATAVADAIIQATYQATAGPPTPFPPYVITATPRYVVVTSTPRPENRATSEAISARATIIALQVGTFTPTPPNWVTATATRRPTDLPLLLPLSRLTATPLPTGTPRPRPIPSSLRGKIAFRSDRLGDTRLFVMDPDGSNVAWLTQSYPYDQSRALEATAPDGVRRINVQPDNRGIPQLFLVDPRFQYRAAITSLTGMCYDPAWSPAAERIAFVSTEEGNDEMYLVNSDGSGLRRLTFNDWEWDKHPSWSPDGTQIVFYSNRYTGRRQIWIMNADGSGQRNISNNEYEDWDPVWIK